MELKMVERKMVEHKDGIDTATRFELGRYEVILDVTQWNDGKVTSDMEITSDWREKYLPTIYYEKKFTEPKGHFEIQTTSYGSMVPEDIDKVIAGLQEAQEAVKVLNKDIWKWM